MIRFHRNKILAATVFAFAGQIFGSEVTMTNVQTMAKSMHLGLEYRGGIVYDDNGLDKQEGVDASSETLVTLNVARLRLKGSLTDSAEYSIRYDLLTSKVQYAKVTWWPTEMIGMTVGRDKTKQNGWEAYNSVYATLVGSHYSALTPFIGFADTISLHAKVAGMVTLQLLDDQVTDDTTRPAGEFNKSKRQPAFILEWLGDMGGIKPLVQIGSYDLNHSMYFTLSGAMAMGGMDTSLTLVQDMRRSQDATDPKKELTDTYTSVVAEGSYVVGNYRPFGKVTYMDVKQDTNAKGNSVGVNSQGDPTMAFDDNGMIVNLGVFGPEQAKIVRPYIAMAYEAGTFYKLTAADKTEAKSKTSLYFGLAGEL